MAVTKIWPVRSTANRTIDYVSDENKTVGKAPEESWKKELNSAIEYAINMDKTMQRKFVTGINCYADTAKEEFLMVKKRYEKNEGIMVYHAIQSFAKDEVTPEQAHEIGLKLAEKMWGERFQVVVATHLNTDCVHNHFVVNSVSFRDGKRCRDKHWFKLNKASDELCREYSLSIVERSGKGVPAGIARANKEGKPTRLNIAKAAIDEAIGSCTNIRELKIVLKNRGFECQFDPGRRYWTIRQRDWQRPIRLVRMGEEYSKENLLARLSMGRNEKPFTLFQRASKPQKREYLFLTRGDRLKKKGGLKNLYLYYCYKLGYLPKYKQKQVSPLLREDLLKIDRISEEVRFLCRENINTSEELAACKERITTDMEKLIDERTDIRKAVRRNIPEEDKTALKKEISTLSDRIKEYREDMNKIQRIEERSVIMEKKIIAAERQNVTVQRGGRER